MEELDDADLDVLGRLGYAVARSQLFEYALLKLLEQQRFNTGLPLEDRWPEIQQWLTKKTAGQAARQIAVHKDVATDLIQAADQRNLIVHHAWRFYLTARAREGQAAVEAYTAWLVRQAALLVLRTTG